MDIIRENVLRFQFHHKHNTDALKSIYDVSHSSMSYILIEDVNAIFDRVYILSNSTQVVFAYLNEVDA